MAKKFIAALMLALAVALTAACRDDNNGGEYANGEIISIDLNGGAEAFVGYEPELLSLSVDGAHLDFVGISLNRVLENRGAADFARILLVTSNRDGPDDITRWARADAGVFLAWGESGAPESPFRVFPKDAAAADLMVPHVTEIIVEMNP